MRAPRMITLPTTKCGDVFIHVPVGHVTNTLEVDIRDVFCACATNFNHVNTPRNLHNKKSFETAKIHNGMISAKWKASSQRCSWCKKKKIAVMALFSCQTCENEMVFDRRKFRSQTSDNVDRWKSRGGKSQRREKKKEDQKRKRIREKKMQVCGKR